MGLCAQYYWPVSSTKTVTAWIPLQAVSDEMGPLEYAVGSQQHDLGRHLSISGENELEILEVCSAAEVIIPCPNSRVLLQYTALVTLNSSLPLY